MLANTTSSMQYKCRNIAPHCSFKTCVAYLLKPQCTQGERVHFPRPSSPLQRSEGRPFVAFRLYYCCMLERRTGFVVFVHLGCEMRQQPRAPTYTHVHNPGNLGIGLPVTTQQKRTLTCEAGDKWQGLLLCHKRIYVHGLGWTRDVYVMYA